MRQEGGAPEAGEYRAEVGFGRYQNAVKMSAFCGEIGRTGAFRPCPGAFWERDDPLDAILAAGAKLVSHDAQ